MKKIYLYMKYSKHKEIRGYILDISNNGMGMALASPVEIKKRTSINVLFKKAAKAVSLRAKVMNVSKLDRRNYNYRLGVRLILSKAQRNFLNKLVVETLGKIRLSK